MFVGFIERKRAAQSLLIYIPLQLEMLMDNWRPSLLCSCLIRGKSDWSRSSVELLLVKFVTVTELMVLVILVKQ